MNRKIILAFIISTLTLPVNAELPAEPSETPETQEKEIIESHWGVALGAGWIQDYPGADQGRMRYLAIPTFKGKYLTIDRQDGVRGELIDDQIIKFSVSFMFLFPTASEKIPARQGMPDLDWVFQLGPEMQVYFSRTKHHIMYLRLPFRFVSTTDFKHRFDYRDWNFAPSLRNVFQIDGYGEIMTRLEAEIASEAYSDFLYEVQPQYATASRPTYNARSGLLQYIVGAQYTYNENFPWSYSFGTNAYITKNAANRESPLLLRSVNYSFLFSVIRYF